MLSVFVFLITFKTIISTSVIAVSTPTTIKCLPGAQFSTVVKADAVANKPPVAETLATTACARRRRDVEHLLADSNLPKASIEPAQPIA